jgi:hypothetical protein
VRHRRDRPELVVAAVTVAGWAWDYAPLLDVASRSAQADGAILLLAVGSLALLFLLLRGVWRWFDARAWRRGIFEAHRTNGRGRGTA